MPSTTRKVPTSLRTVTNEKLRPYSRVKIQQLVVDVHFRNAADEIAILYLKLRGRRQQRQPSDLQRAGQIQETMARFRYDSAPTWKAIIISECSNIRTRTRSTNGAPWFQQLSGLIRAQVSHLRSVLDGEHRIAVVQRYRSRLRKNHILTTPFITHSTMIQTQSHSLC